MNRKKYRQNSIDQTISMALILCLVVVGFVAAYYYMSPTAQPTKEELGFTPSAVEELQKKLEDSEDFSPPQKQSVKPIKFIDQFDSNDHMLSYFKNSLQKNGFELYQALQTQDIFLLFSQNSHVGSDMNTLNNLNMIINDRIQKNAPDPGSGNLKPPSPPAGSTAAPAPSFSPVAPKSPHSSYHHVRPTPTNMYKSVESLRNHKRYRESRIAKLKKMLETPDDHFPDEIKEMELKIKQFTDEIARIDVDLAKNEKGMRWTRRW